MLFLFARKEKMLWPLLTLWTFATLAGRALQAASESNIVTCVPFFLCGVIAYIAFMRRVPRIPGMLLLPVVLALACAYAIHPTLYSGWIACLILALILPSFRQAPWNLWTRAGHVIAKYSYGVYLLHQWSLALAFYYLPTHSLAIKLIAELASLAVAAPLAYHYIENPMIEMGKRVAARIQRTSPELALR
jgi:peptidoglycan/LPS O-acetylase OafA/YrhL